MEFKNILIILVLFSCVFCSKNAGNIEKIKSEVLETVKAHNKAWTVLEDLEEQGKYIHDNITFITPGDHSPFEGKEAYLTSYREWYDAAKVHFFSELEPRAYLSENLKSAVVIYYIDMAFNYKGEEQTFKGRDLFFLTWENGKWLIMANEYSPFPEKEGEE